MTSVLEIEKTRIQRFIQWSQTRMEVEVENDYPLLSQMNVTLAAMTLAGLRSLPHDTQIQLLGASIRGHYNPAAEPLGLRVQKVGDARLLKQFDELKAKEFSKFLMSPRPVIRKGVDKKVERAFLAALIDQIGQSLPGLAFEQRNGSFVFVAEINGWRLTVDIVYDFAQPAKTIGYEMTVYNDAIAKDVEFQKLTAGQPYSVHSGNVLNYARALGFDIPSGWALLPEVEIDALVWAICHTVQATYEGLPSLVADL